MEGRGSNWSSPSLDLPSHRKGVGGSGHGEVRRTQRHQCPSRHLDSLGAAVPTTWDGHQRLFYLVLTSASLILRFCQCMTTAEFMEVTKAAAHEEGACVVFLRPSQKNAFCVDVLKVNGLHKNQLLRSVP